MHKFIKSLSVHNFRNYKHLFLRFDATQPVVFFGANGAGKTNILEAISMFSSRKGMRRAASKDVQCKNSIIPWAVVCELSDGLKLGVGINGDGRKIFKIGGKSATFTDLGEHIWVTWLTPRMDLIFSENGTERRKFFDHLVSGVIKGHKSTLSEYKTLIKERVNVLVRSHDHMWLKKLEEQIASLGVRINRNRESFIGFIGAEVPNLEMKLSGEFEKCPELNVFLALLEKSRKHDMMYATTSIGPHKTSWDVTNKNKQIAIEFCSTGEQKDSVIDVLKASVKVYSSLNYGCCVLLLDEVFAHLDSCRIKRIIDVISDLDVHCLVTSVDGEIVKLFRSVHPIQVENGICY